MSRPVFRVHITRDAMRQLEDAAAWITVDSPKNAAMLFDRVLFGIRRLQDMPRRHQRYINPDDPDSEYRAFVVRPCRVFYRVEGDSLTVVAIVHAARRCVFRRV